jgi:hypothetical protein
LCWGFKTGDCRAEMTYKCVNISPWLPVNFSKRTGHSLKC